MGLAVFDIDGTLVTGASTERRLFRAMLAAGLLGPRQLLAFAAFAVRYAPEYGRHVFKKDKAYLSGLAVDEVARFAAHWAPGALRSSWFGPAVERLREHRRRGDRVVLLSGTPDFLARVIAGELGADDAIGSRCAAAGGRYTAAPPLVHPFGGAKCCLVEQLCRELGESPADVAAYGDSDHDLPLLRAVGRPVAVRPAGGLARVARGAGWEIIAASG
ncbi:MAG: HAD-IB family phosphatase [Chromatiales bacterium]|nr:HAD-IB family phosphatase [Chromatiales bacterium]